MYGVQPDGAPIVLLNDETGAHLLAAQARALDPMLTGGASWRCERICRLDLPTDPDTAAETRLLTPPERVLPLGLAAWFLLPRTGAYGWR